MVAAIFLILGMNCSAGGLFSGPRFVGVDSQYYLGDLTPISWQRDSWPSAPYLRVVTVQPGFIWPSETAP
ncbi:hypothetical protein KC19_9G123800 [Ceratodon purpureus]|uniref:Uncharacterized protein n=1 Tax=Ceratodon purpureus TaxID=3225 RepID=A0A8T0GVK7_CERPU|nr:hypothetical protein KC19_9G123800 [Ceratodon purpureus]